MNTKNILIVCALEQETQNELDDYNVLYTGVGKVNATYSLTRELLYQQTINYDVRSKIVINYGTAASKVHKGLIQCTRFIQRDMDASPLGFKKGETPFEDGPSMIDFSTSGNNNCCYTGDSFATDLTPYDDVVDMEAYALAKVCRHFDIEFISYKYISDDGNADDWVKNCSKGVIEFKKQVLNNIKE
tara:strand:+ start:83 stop:643 length:561 start_codon:yes stop_codon:yes gene_type:complete